MNTSNSQNWEPCPKGELTTIVGKIRAGRRDKAMAQLLGVAGAFLVLISAGALIIHQVRASSTKSTGSITCSDVKANLDDYVTGMLDDQLSERIRVHLTSCEACRKIHEKMIGSRQTAQVGIETSSRQNSPSARRNPIALLEMPDQ